MRLRAQTVNPRHRRFAGLNGVPDCAELHQTGDLDLGHFRAGRIEIGAQFAQAPIHHHLNGLLGEFDLIIEQRDDSGVVVYGHRFSWPPPRV